MANIDRDRRQHEREVQVAETLHMAVLEAVSQARRHTDGDLVFQGGSALAFVYGSGRHSEDLDFLAGDTADLDKIMNDALKFARNASYLDGLYKSEQVTLRSAPKNKDPDRRLRVYTLRVDPERKSEAGLWIKAEFYRLPAELLARYDRHQGNARPHTGDGFSARFKPILPTATAEELYLDKIHALGARSYTKSRDIYDLWWLCESAGAFQTDGRAAAASRFDYHLQFYNHSPDSAEDLVAKAQERLATVTIAEMESELRAFVPRRLDQRDLYRMLEVAKSEVAAFASELSELRGPAMGGG